MKALLDLVLTQRARRLAQRLAPHLPRTGRGLDIGSGTGHTMQALRRRVSLSFVQADVVDISVVGAGPVLFRGPLPFADGAFTCSLLLFVLSYPDDPLSLLREAGRVTSGPILVLQSTCRGGLGRAALHTNEFLWGPLAFWVARTTRFIGRRAFTLGVHHLFTREELRALFHEAGLDVRALHSQPWPALPVSGDLYILERYDAHKSPIGDHPGTERKNADRPGRRGRVALRGQHPRL